jgi:hypothetical protein
MSATTALQGLEPYATYMKSPPDSLIKPFRAQTIRIIVSGGGIQTTWFATDFGVGRGTLVNDWK